MSPAAALIECLDARGRVLSRERFVLDGERRTITIGRSVAADFHLDDEHVAPMHAEVKVSPEGRILLSDLGSLNGIVIGSANYRGARELPTDGTFQLGRTLIRVRTSYDPVAPERQHHHHAASLLAHPLWLAAVGAVLTLAQLAYSSWLSAPRDLAGSIASSLATAALLVAIWVGVWALLTRVIRGEWRWQSHLAISLLVAGLVMAIDGLLDFGWFALALPRWGMREEWLLIVAFAVALYLHLVNASTMAARRAAFAAVLLPALIGGAGAWYMQRSNDRDVNGIDGFERLYPPSVRLRRAQGVEDYFRGAAALRQAADRKRQAAQDDEPE